MEPIFERFYTKKGVDNTESHVQKDCFLYFPVSSGSYNAFDIADRVVDFSERHETASSVGVG